MYIVALPTEPIEEKVAELNEIGRATGGTAHGYVNISIHTYHYSVHISLVNMGLCPLIRFFLCSLPADVKDKDSIASIAQYITQRETHLDILVSNAGIRRDPPISCNVLTASLTELQESLWSSRPADWADTFSVNTTAHYFLSVALLPLLARASALELGDGRVGRLGRSQMGGRGVIVITSSCASMHNATNVDMTSYATSKAATDHLVRLLAAKFNRFYVRVAGINPGCESRFFWRFLPPPPSSFQVNWKSEKLLGLMS